MMVATYRRRQMASLGPAELMARKGQRGCTDKEEFLAKEGEFPSRGTGFTILLPENPRRVGVGEGPTRKTVKRILQTPSP